MLPAIDYLDWFEGRPQLATHDLGSSDLRSAGCDGVVPPRLDGLPDPPPERTLADQLAGEYGVKSDQVLVTAGASLANVLAVAAAVGRGADDLGKGRRTRERLLVERPGYEPHAATPRALGLPVDRFRRTPGAGWGLEPERIAAAAGETTALVSVSNRHNPTGHRSSRERLAAVAGAARDAGARLLVDEVYAPFGAGEATGAFGGPTAAGLEGVVVASSLTKFHGLGGLRVGWLIADRAFVERARGAATHLPTVADPSRALARGALHNRETLAERSRDRLLANARRLEAFVSARDDLSGAVFPDCSFAFPAHDRLDGDELAERAWNADVLVVPGRFFGSREYFRISLGGEPAATTRALDALGSVLDGC